MPRYMLEPAKCEKRVLNKIRDITKPPLASARVLADREQ
jgi:hypothetical protein